MDSINVAPATPGFLIADFHSKPCWPPILPGTLGEALILEAISLSGLQKQSLGKISTMLPTDCSTF